MKKKLITSLFVFGLFGLIGCAEVKEKADEKFRLLNDKTQELDSVINHELNKAQQLDSLIDKGREKLNKLDSVIENKSNRIDSLINNR
jgi:peptidoglycan hydrolase CwlO-like protein